MLDFLTLGLEIDIAVKISHNFINTKIRFQFLFKSSKIVGVLIHVTKGLY